MNKMKIAAVQYKSIHKKIAENLLRHEGFIKTAKANGAEMVVFPELSVTGYIPNYSLWDVLLENKTDVLEWMKEKSRQYKVFLGIGLIEYMNKNIRNTYVITDLQGNLAGRAEKDHAESYVFKMGNGVHIININDKKIGVCICADNHFTEIIEKMQKENISLFLMPHAWPTPYKVGNGVKQKDIIKQNDELKKLPVRIAQLLKVPIVFVNQIGTMDKMSGLFGKFMAPDNFKLQGFSRIIDSKGTLLSEIDDKEGIIYSDIDITNNKNIEYDSVPNFDGWIHEGSMFLRKILAPIDIALGQIKYKNELKKFIQNHHLTNPLHTDRTSAAGERKRSV